VLVAIFQRGAMDGVAAVPPLDDTGLRRLRPRLLDPRRASGVLDLDGRFGLHPAFGPLEPLFRDTRLAVVHGIGSPDPTRSHFDAQDYMESGTPGRKGTSSGWLNRVAGELGHDATPFRSVALTPALPRSLTGPAPSIAVARLEDLRAPGSTGPNDPAGGFEALWSDTAHSTLGRAGDDTFEAVHALDQRWIASYRPARGARYPRSPLGDALRQIAMLIKAKVGLEIGFAESGGWDTHVRQGAGEGTFARRADDLARSIAAFWTDLGTEADDVVLMTMTEFGRTVAENGAGGTDHGHGSCSFVLGHSIQGGRVLGDVAGFARDQLYEGRDLPVTTDFRAVFAGVAEAHLGVKDAPKLFPGWAGRPLPLTG
jgi:uncharacterized protein (DUF1501 family)